MQKHTQTYWHFSSLVVVLACLAAVLVPLGVAHADDGTTSLPPGSDTSSTETQGANCSDVAVTASGSFSAPADTYDVYVRLGAGSSAETDTLYAHVGSQVTDCKTIGKATVTDKAWTKLGTYAATGADTGLQLVSSSAGLVQSFNQPTVLLVSHSKPACHPKAECTITVDGMRGALRASASGSGVDTFAEVRPSAKRA